MGFAVWGLKFEVWGLGFGVCGLRFVVWGLGFGVCGLRFVVWGLGFGVQDLGVPGRDAQGSTHVTVNIPLPQPTPC